jgi:hypothetical protein
MDIVVTQIIFTLTGHDNQYYYIFPNVLNIIMATIYLNHLDYLNIRRGFSEIQFTMHYQQGIEFG